MDKKQFISEAVDLLSPYFEDNEKSRKWLYVRNPYFGYISPIQMYTDGKGEEVLKFIKQAKEFWDL